MTDNTWDEYHEQRLTELEHKIAELEREKDYYERQMPVLDRMAEENAILRAMLPSAETRQALRRAMVDAGWSHSDNAHVWAWLGRLESNDAR